MLKAMYRLTSNIHGGTPSPFDMYDTHVKFFCLIKPFMLEFQYNPKWLICSLSLVLHCVELTISQ
jgi:hypothetical protein